MNVSIETEYSSHSEETGLFELNDCEAEKVIISLIDCFRQYADLSTIISEQYHSLDYDYEFDELFSDEPECTSLSLYRIDNILCELVYTKYSAQEMDWRKSLGEHFHFTPKVLKSDTYRISDSEHVGFNYYKEVNQNQ